MPGLDISVCLDPSAIKNKDAPGGRISAPEATVDSVLTNVGPRSPALRQRASRLGALFLRPARLARPRPSNPRGLVRAGHLEPEGRRVCA